MDPTGPVIQWPMYQFSVVVIFTMWKLKNNIESQSLGLFCVACQMSKMKRVTMRNKGTIDIFFTK